MSAFIVVCCVCLYCGPVWGQSQIDNAAPGATDDDRAARSREHEFTELSKQYSATLDYSDQPLGYACRCDNKDVWRLTSFHYRLGEKFEVAVGPAEVVFGCHGTNVLWAAIFPHEPGTIVLAPAGQGERLTSLWLRFHPQRVSDLFPAETVVKQGDAAWMNPARLMAQHKTQSSWQVGGQPMVPFKETVILDMETSALSRRFYAIDASKGTVEYVDHFRTRPLSVARMIESETAVRIFDEVWNAFDREYAMFVIKPTVDWGKLRTEFRLQAAAAPDNHALAHVIAEMVAHLEDLHIYVQVDEMFVPGYQRDRPLNGNGRAATHLIGTLTDTGHELSWGRTKDAIGYMVIPRLTDPELPRVFYDVLEQMRDTRGLILDLRFNGGGSELLGRAIAGCFLDREYVYSMHQFREGPQHTDLGAKVHRKCKPSGPWHYVGPVVVLQGQRTMSSAESFALMLAQCPQVTTMGDRTAGSSGNPRRVSPGAGIVVNLPRWLDLDPDGKPIDGIGIPPQVLIDAPVNSFSNQQDPVLTAALKHLREGKEPSTPVLKVRSEGAQPAVP